jgi:hypothetical protein
LAFSQAHAWSTAILVEEFNANRFQRAANRQIVGSCHRGFIFRELSSRRPLAASGEALSALAADSLLKGGGATAVLGDCHISTTRRAAHRAE